MKKLLRLREVVAKCGASKSTVYREMKAGRFPRPVRLGAKSSAWVESEVDKFIERLRRERDRGAAR